jgi:hypothetical protein
LKQFWKNNTLRQLLFCLIIIINKLLLYLKQLLKQKQLLRANVTKWSLFFRNSLKILNKINLKMQMPKLFLLLLCSIQLPGKYLLIKLSEKGKTYYLINWKLLNLISDNVFFGLRNQIYPFLISSLSISYISRFGRWILLWFV